MFLINNGKFIFNNVTFENVVTHDFLFESWDVNNYTQFVWHDISFINSTTDSIFNFIGLYMLQNSSVINNTSANGVEYDNSIEFINTYFENYTNPNYHIHIYCILIRYGFEIIISDSRLYNCSFYGLIFENNLCVWSSSPIQQTYEDAERALSTPGVQFTKYMNNMEIVDSRIKDQIYYGYSILGNITITNIDVYNCEISNYLFYFYGGYKNNNSMPYYTAIYGVNATISNVTLYDTRSLWWNSFNVFWFKNFRHVKFNNILISWSNFTQSDIDNGKLYKPLFYSYQSNYGINRRIFKNICVYNVGFSEDEWFIDYFSSSNLLVNLDEFDNNKDGSTDVSITHVTFDNCKIGDDYHFFYVRGALYYNSSSSQESHNARIPGKRVIINDVTIFNGGDKNERSRLFFICHFEYVELSNIIVNATNWTENGYAQFFDSVTSYEYGQNSIVFDNITILSSGFDDNYFDIIDFANVSINNILFENIHCIDGCNVFYIGADAVYLSFDFTMTNVYYNGRYSLASANIDNYGLHYRDLFDLLWINLYDSYDTLGHRSLTTINCYNITIADVQLYTVFYFELQTYGSANDYKVDTIIANT